MGLIKENLDFPDSLEGNVVDVEEGTVFRGIVRFEGEVISAVEALGPKYPLSLDSVMSIEGPFILPGLVDGHIHIESSMLTPSRFGEIAVTHGTTSVVSDPHEIANVAGLPGIEYMVKDALNSPINIYYTVPSCVPATTFETSGAVLSSLDVARLLERPEFVALGEMMNYPGVLGGDGEVMAKIQAAKDLGKPVDGHAPFLLGEKLANYISAGITTDHECTTLAEAEEKARAGMVIQVRQGSAARNLKDLVALYGHFEVMTVSDDRNPMEMLEGHMNSHLKLLLSQGVKLLDALLSMTLVPCRTYGLNSGSLTPGKLADIIIVKDLTTFEVMETYVRGKKVYGEGVVVNIAPVEFSSYMSVPSLDVGKLEIRVEDGLDDGHYSVNIIGVRDGQLFTEKKVDVLEARGDVLSPNVMKDILPLVVVERYGNGGIGKGFVKGFGLRSGALASTIAHDSHNIICVGSDHLSMYRAIDLVSRKGGVAAVKGERIEFLPLPVAGLMSPRACNWVARRLGQVRELAIDAGCTLTSPVVTLSFLALLVIPSIKLSDRGLFDCEAFTFLDVIADREK